MPPSTLAWYLQVLAAIKQACYELVRRLLDLTWVRYPPLVLYFVIQLVGVAQHLIELLDPAPAAHVSSPCRSSPCTPTTVHRGSFCIIDNCSRVHRQLGRCLYALIVTVLQQTIMGITLDLEYYIVPKIRQVRRRGCSVLRTKSIWRAAVCLNTESVWSVIRQA